MMNLTVQVVSLPSLLHFSYFMYIIIARPSQLGHVNKIRSTSVSSVRYTYVDLYHSTSQSSMQLVDRQQARRMTIYIICLLIVIHVNKASHIHYSSYSSTTHAIRRSTYVRIYQIYERHMHQTPLYIFKRNRSVQINVTYLFKTHMLGTNEYKITCDNNMKIMFYR